MAEQPIPPGREWTGSHKVAKDSRWLCAEDLPADRDVPVEIEKVMRRDGLVMQEGRKLKTALSLKFRGKQKELILNATNRKTLAMLFDSQECGAWFGKKVLLHVVPNVRYPDGTRGPAIRIRAQRVAQNKTGSDVVYERLQDNPVPDDAEQRAIMLEAIDTEMLALDLDQSALLEFAGVESLDSLSVAQLSDLLKRLTARRGGE